MEGTCSDGRSKQWWKVPLPASAEEFQVACDAINRSHLGTSWSSLGITPSLATLELLFVANAINALWWRRASTRTRAQSTSQLRPCELTRWLYLGDPRRDFLQANVESSNVSFQLPFHGSCIHGRGIGAVNWSSRPRWQAVTSRSAGTCCGGAR